MGETLAKDRPTMSQPFFGTTQFSLDVLHVKTTNILEFDSLQQIPDPFLWVQLRGISRQLFQMNALGAAFSQVLFDGLTAMNRSPIPDDQQVAGNFARKHLQKANDIWAFVRMILHLHDDLSFGSDAAHDRKMITGQLDFQHGGLAYRCIGTHCHGQKIKRRLIDKNYRPLFLFRLFFSAGHRSSFHAWMAISSRWVARVMGFCRLCLTRRRRRLAWAR